MKFELTPYQQRRLAHLDVDIVRRTAIPTGPSPDDIRYNRVAIRGETPAQGQVRG